MIKPGMGNEIRNKMENEMATLYHINVSNILGSLVPSLSFFERLGTRLILWEAKRRKEIIGLGLIVEDYGIERRPVLSNDKKSKKLYCRL